MRYWSSLYGRDESRQMREGSKNTFRTAELNPELLATPFEIQTNWHVLTGAPCCGKTTIIDQLANEGFRTVPESAHLYIEQELDLGRQIGEILKDRIELQTILIEMQIGTERKLPADEVAFLDRALPDSLAFNRFVGIDPNGLLPECFHHRYASVFVLDPLPFQEDGIRDFDSVAVDYLDEWLARDYSTLGYPIVRVPVLAPDERFEFVLARLSKLGTV